MPSVDQLPSLRYRARAWNPLLHKYEVVKNPEPGSRGTYEYYATAWEAAKAAESRIDQRQQDVGLEVTRRVRRLPFIDVADTWHSTVTGSNPQSDHTITHYWRKLKEAFRGHFIDEITAAMILDYDAKCRKAGLSESMRARNITYLRQIMAVAINSHAIDRDPTFGLSVKVGSRKPRPIDAQDFALLTHYMPRWFYPLAILSYHAGLRAEEAAALRWFRLRLDGPQPAVHVIDVLQIDGTVRAHTKSGEGTGRWVPLAPDAVHALKDLRAWRRTDAHEDFVLRHSKNQRVARPAYIGEVMREAFAKSGLPGEVRTYHQLRHAFGTNLARAGASAFVIKDLMGHKSIASSQVYVDATRFEDARRFVFAASGAPLLTAIDGEAA